MLLVIFVIILAAGISLYVWYNNHYHAYATWIEATYCIANIVGVITVAISVIILLCSYIGVDAKIEKNKAVYDSLVYQYENSVFNDDDDAVGKKELYNQIKDWNADLKYYQSIQRDFWLGIYYPNIFDQFKLIEYHK